MAEPLTIWTNALLPETEMQRLRTNIAPHRLIVSKTVINNLGNAQPDPELMQADIAFGQPDTAQVIESKCLRWVHLTTAGYTRYDRDDVRQALRGRQAVMTNSSTVFAEPCAQHALAMVLALSRQLPFCAQNQAALREWPQAALRDSSRLLRGQTMLIVGFGAIGRRLAGILSPFEMQLIGFRRNARGDESIEIQSINSIDERLGEADHVMNILPASDGTRNFFSRARLGRIKPGAILYNIGRGATVDQEALREALNAHRLGGAYLDVTEPEPLPADHPLWRTRNCWITPHVAGGDDAEFDRLVTHFSENLRRWNNHETLLDRII